MLVFILSAPGVQAQYVETRVENAEVVYVEGNDVVLKYTNGEVRQFEIPDSNRFTIDNKDVTVHELKPGMKLTAMISTENAPRWVDTVEITEVGTVWKTVGRSLIIKTPQGENKMYRVPSGSKITLDGTVKTVDQLREGDKITATIVRTSAPLEIRNAAPLVRKAPPTPARVGALLIDEGAKPGEPPPTWGTLAIIILIAVLLLAAALVMLAFRRKRKA
jgi:hypothetical protein